MKTIKLNSISGLSLEYGDVKSFEAINGTLTINFDNYTPLNFELAKVAGIEINYGSDINE